MNVSPPAGQPPVLSTERLQLRPVETDDEAFLLDLYGLAQVQRFIGLDSSVPSRGETLARIRRYVEFSHPVQGIWLAQTLTEGAACGVLLLNDLPASGPSLLPSGQVQVGWHFHPNWWGQGLATEAARRVLGYAFAAGLPQVLAVTHLENTASQAVATRAGMTAQGRTRAYYNTECELFLARSAAP